MSLSSLVRSKRVLNRLGLDRVDTTDSLGPPPPYPTDLDDYHSNGITQPAPSLSHSLLPPAQKLGIADVAMAKSVAHRHRVRRMTVKGSLGPAEIAEGPVSPKNLANGGSGGGMRLANADASPAPTKGLWDEALASLTAEEQKSLKLAESSNEADGAGASAGASMTGTVVVSRLQEHVLRRRDEAESKRWSFVRKDGSHVSVRAIFERVSVWLDRFKQIGDVAVSYDPVHAALPWAGVRLLLQVAVNDVEIYGRMLEGVEYVVGVIARFRDLEDTDYHAPPSHRDEIRKGIVRIYAGVLRYLAKALHYYCQSSAERITKSIFHTQRTAVNVYIDQIMKEENMVYQLLPFIQVETLRREFRVFQSQQDAEAEKAIRSKLLKWIDCVYTHDEYDQAWRVRHRGTCDWALRIPELQQWLASEPSSVLWLHGRPGMGKSILFARLLKHLADSEKRPLAFFFCVSEDVKKRDPYAILRSWISQLIKASDRSLIATLEPYAELNERPPTISELWKLFAIAVRSHPQVVLALDGYDECTDSETARLRAQIDDRRVEFLRGLMEALTDVRAHILITSRDDHDIRSEIMGSPSEYAAVKKFEYLITPANNLEDIQVVSTALVEQQLKSKTDSLKQEIAETAAEKCDGMFLLLTLYGKALKAKASKNAKALRNVLLELPSGIEAAYNREMQRFSAMDEDDQATVATMLRWVLFAERPLTVKELVEAVAHTNNEEDCYPADDLPDSWESGITEDDIQNLIRDPCGTLVEVRKTEENQRPARQTVHLVHYSVKEYLLKKRSSSSAQPMPFDFAKDSQEHGHLGASCLKYLTYPEIGEGFDGTIDSAEERRLKYPMLRYTAKFWTVHLSKSGGISPDVLEIAGDFFDPDSLNWALCQRIWQVEPMNVLVDTGTDLSFDNEPANFAENHFKEEEEPPEEKSKEDGKEDDEQETSAEEKYKVGQDESTAQEESGFVVVGDKDGIPTEEDTKETKPTINFPGPIYIAAMLGHLELLEALCARGLDVNDEGGRFGSPLQGAIAYGQFDAAKLLMRKGAAVSEERGEYGCPLNAAAAHGNFEICRMLLDAGAKPSLSRAGRNALHFSAHSGDTKTFDLLLERIPDLNASSDSGETPLCRACASGRSEIVKILLGKGVKTTDHHGDCWTPLSIAAFQCQFDVVKTLVEAGADVNYIDKRGCCALHAAVERAPLEIVQYLLDHGAEATVNASWTVGGIQKSPLILALEFSPTPVAMAKALLARGADIRKSSGWGEPILHVACGIQNNSSALTLDLLRLLLEHGADLNVVDYAGRSVLSVLFMKNSCVSVDIVKLLIDAGADPKLKGFQGWTPLDFALRYCMSGDFEAILDLLIERGANVNSETDFGVRSLVFAMASEKCNFNVIKKLVEAGADPKLKGFQGWTPLDFALRHCMAGDFGAIIDLLIERGANVNSETDLGVRSLTFAMASEKYNLKVIKKLVEAGADVNARQKKGNQNTPLFDAIGYGHEDAVDFLIQQGADITALHVTNSKGVLHLVTTAKSPSPAIAKALIKAGADIEARGMPSGPVLWTPLMVACDHGHMDIVKVFVEAGANVEGLMDVEGMDATPLKLALSHHNSELLKYLLSKGANVNERTTRGGISPLQFAITQEQDREPRMSKILLAHGADVNSVDDSKSSILSYAVQRGTVETVRMCLRLELRMPEVVRRGMSPLITAVCCRDPEKVRLLGEWFGDLSAHDGEGDSAAFFLRWAGDEPADPTMASLLIEYHAFDAIGTEEGDAHRPSGEMEKLRVGLLTAAFRGDIQAVSKYAKEAKCIDSEMLLNSALFAATAGNSIQVMEKLIDEGANVEARLPNQRTPLQLAIFSRSVDAVQVLLDRGADVFAKDIRGANAVDQLPRVPSWDQQVTQLVLGHATRLRNNEVEKNREILDAIAGKWHGSHTRSSSGGGIEEVWLHVTLTSSLNEERQSIHGTGASNPDGEPEMLIFATLYTDGTMHAGSFYQTMQEGGNFYGVFDPLKGTIKGEWGVSRDLIEGVFSFEKQPEAAKDGSQA